MTIDSKTIFSNFLHWLFGIIVLAIGIINICWGNDQGFGVFLILLSFIYFPPVLFFLRSKTGITIHMMIKIFLGVFIIWAALGVGELLPKINLALKHI